MADRVFYRLSLPTPALAVETIQAVAESFTQRAWTPDDVARLHRDEHGWADIDAEHRTIGEAEQAAHDILRILREHSSVRPFIVSESPGHEGLGTLCRYAPALGLHTVDCDASDRPVVAGPDLLAVLAGVGDVRAQVHEVLGTAWAGELAQSRSAR